MAKQKSKQMYAVASGDGIEDLFVWTVRSYEGGAVRAYTDEVERYGRSYESDKERLRLRVVTLQVTITGEA